MVMTCYEGFILAATDPAMGIPLPRPADPGHQDRGATHGGRMTSTFTPIPQQGLTDTERTEEIAALEARLAAVREAPTRVLPVVTKVDGDNDIILGARVLIALHEAGTPAADIQRFGENAYGRISSARHSYSGSREADIAAIARQHGVEVREAEAVSTV
jgi:hypothetical protein